MLAHQAAGEFIVPHATHATAWKNTKGQGHENLLKISGTILRLGILFTQIALLSPASPP
jgi:hypothetical protein